MTRTLALSLLVLAACGQKEESSTAAADEAAAPSSDNVPADKASQAFATKLFDLQISNFRPIDSTGATLVYDSFSFSPDGSWQAQGAVSIADETMECQEVGTWTMDPADDNNVAAMTWSVTKTSCAGREAGTEQRVKMTILKDGQYKVDFR